MENGENQQPTSSEIPPKAPESPEEQQLREKTEDRDRKPQELTEQLLTQMSKQVDTEEEQTPKVEIDHKDRNPEIEVVGLTAAPRTHPSPETSIPKVETSFKIKLGADQGKTAQEATDTINKLREAA